MNNLDRLFFAIGSFMAGLAVAAGAYGAHGGPSLDTDQVRWIAKAARYHMYHGIALIIVSWAMTQWQDRAKMFQVSGWLFLMGIILFSGSLYMMALTGVNLGYLTPFGGIAFLAGWFIMACAGILKK